MSCWKLGSMVSKWVISYNLYTTYTSTYIINDVILGVKLTHWILSFYQPQCHIDLHDMVVFLDGKYIPLERTSHGNPKFGLPNSHFVKSVLLPGAKAELPGFYHQILAGGFLKWWYPTTMGFPTKNDHFGVFGGYHHLRKHPAIAGCPGKEVLEKG